jgi:5-methylcytosine-specific restriction protein A
MAASGGLIPCVLDSAGVILDWGRERRLFTRSQRLALVERDGGCAMCGLPPGMTRAHHIKWWRRDKGRTDLESGVLLCEACHHRIHDNGWEVRIDGSGTRARVWFVPPRHVDAERTPRLGGRARFDYLAA